MTEIELKQKLKEAEESFEVAKMHAKKLFASSNNPYKIGDKVSDHVQTIIIRKLVFIWDHILYLNAFILATT